MSNLHLLTSYSKEVSLCSSEIDIVNCFPGEYQVTSVFFSWFVYLIEISIVYRSKICNNLTALYLNISYMVVLTTTKAKRHWGKDSLCLCSESATPAIGLINKYWERLKVNICHKLIKCFEFLLSSFSYAMVFICDK